MALPTNKIKKIKLPDNSEYEIIPSTLQDGTTNYKATLPTLTADATLATTDDIKISDVKINNTSIVSNGIANLVTNAAYDASTNKIATMDDLEEIDVSLLVEKTYSELKTLRNNSQLVPGQKYRITDYECTTTTENTSSAGHVFDIIVLALESNKLSEEAFATHHIGDTYFANNNLEVWKLWYCLDNDSNRFVWPLVPVEEHLVYSNKTYYREPQYDGVQGNYCWYDGTHYYIFTDTLTSPTTGSWWMHYGDDWTSRGSISNIQYVPATSTEGKGVIYRMIDEFGNDCPYDFKNILFTGSSYGDSITYTNAYTFSYTESSVIKDASLLLDKKCYNNVIKKCINSNKKQQLNFNVFYSSSTTFDCYYNTFGNDCQKNTVANSCYYNNFGGGCQSNTLDNSCQYNTLGNNCQYNKFGSACQYNTIGDSSRSTQFGASSTYNTLGVNCKNNTLGIISTNNTFGKSCQYNTLGSNCSNNTFGTSCQNNTLGNSSVSNKFGNYCQQIILGQNSSGNNFKNSCIYIKLGNWCLDNIFGANCISITFGKSSSTINYCEYNIIDDGCQYLNIISTDTSASSSNYLQNVHIHLGTKGTSSSSRKTIEVPDRNLPYETDYYLDEDSNLVSYINNQDPNAGGASVTDLR